jgi:hypothetical protein
MIAKKEEKKKEMPIECDYYLVYYHCLCII